MSQVEPDKYQTMLLTPEGSIVRFADKKMKPETDLAREDNVAKRKAKCQRGLEEA